MDLVKLSDICDVIAGQSPPSSSYNQNKKGLPFFQGKADFKEKYPKVRYWCNNPKKISISNDILISVRAPVGAVNINNKEACIGRGLAAIRCGSDIDLTFLFHFLKSHKKQIEDLGTGSTFKAITIKTLKSLKIPLPPLSTQKRIAEILDNAAALRDKTKQLLTEYDQLAQSIFLDMFGDPVTNPKGWDEQIMTSICSKVTDGTHDTPERIAEGVKFITGKHIRPYKIDYENSDYVTEDVHKEVYKRCNPEKGDVLYTNIGVNLGTAALNIVDYEFSMKNVALLKPKEEIIFGRYLEFFLNSQNMKQKILWIASIGGAQKFLSLNQLRKLKILTPPIQLQNQFAEKIALIEQQKDLAKQELQESEDLFQALLQKAFKGELN